MTNPPTPPPPPWLLILAAMLLGVIAQLGASLALDMAKDRAKLLGFLLLSMVFSGMGFILLAQLSDWDDFTCFALSVLLGGVPALWTLRAGVKAIGQRYGVEVQDITTAPPPAAPPPPPTPGTGETP
ncbi:hypothetical protein [Deinococcus petrolearius]|uniref:Holin n=1 Tax=Deinococcus petrolearius TaxID=1751295 RepID=A0ABW1DDQ4_9DEIO